MLLKDVEKDALSRERYRTLQTFSGQARSERTMLANKPDQVTSVQWEQKMTIVENSPYLDNSLVAANFAVLPAHCDD